MRTNIPDKLTHPFSAPFVTALLLGAALNPINDTLISTALVPIAHNFGISVGRTAILVSAPYLACAVAQPTAGKLAEQIGPRKTFITGVILVFLGGLLGQFSQDINTLVLARVIIGFGTSAGYPSAMFMVQQRAKRAELVSPPGGILGALAVVGLAFIAIGPSIGGVLVATLGWRAIFFLNVPFALLTLAFIFIGVHPDPPMSKQGVRALFDHIDLAGIVGFAITTTALLVFLLSIPTPQWITLIVAVGVGIVFVEWELHAAYPFFDVRELVSNGPVTLTYLRMTFGMLGTFVVLYGLPQWLEAAHGYSADAAGLIILPMGVVSAVVSTWVSHRGWIRPSFLSTGIATVVGGGMMLGLSSTGLPITGLMVAAVFGVTLGAITAGAQLALFTQAAPGRLGTSAGLLRTFNYLGSIGASVISGVTFRHAVTDPGLHLIAWIVAALGAVIIAITMNDHSLRRNTRALRNDTR